MAVKLMIRFKYMGTCVSVHIYIVTTYMHTVYVTIYIEKCSLFKLAKCNLVSQFCITISLV